MQELLAQHGDMLATLVGRLTAWHADRDDILQDVLVTVWQKAGSYREQGSLEGWLRRIAVNRCRNHFRSLQVLRRKLEALAFQLPDPVPSNSAGTDEISPSLQRALQRLNQTERSLVVMYYLEQMSGEEVAQWLGIRPGTLHVRLHRVREKLRRLMSSEGEVS